MKDYNLLKPFTIYRQEYFEGLAREAVADHIQLEANLEWLATRDRKLTWDEILAYVNELDERIRILEEKYR